jgi:hypothetical protein
MTMSIIRRVVLGGTVELRLITGVIAIAVPIVFNVAFFELGRALDHPSTLIGILLLIG